MDVFNYCWVTLLAESRKCNVFFDKNTCKVTNSNDENFEKPLNRISYLYKYGSFNILFFQRCLRDFVSKNSHAVDIFHKICSIKNLNVCSVSTGPGIDIIAFLHALYNLGTPLKESVDFKVISKFGSWRNLVREMTMSEYSCFPKSSTCKLIQCDILTTLSTKAQSYLGHADVLLLYQPFTSVKATKTVTLKVLKNIIQLLKQDALVLFISDKGKFTDLTELNIFGTFLHGPVEVQLDNVPYNEKVVELIGVKPVCSGSSYFALWQKSKLQCIPHEISNIQCSSGKVNTMDKIIYGNHTVLNAVSNKDLATKTEGGQSVGVQNSDFRSESEKSNLSNFTTSVPSGNPHNQVLQDKKQTTVSTENEEAVVKSSFNSLISKIESVVSTLENSMTAQNSLEYFQKNQHDFPKCSHSLQCYKQNCALHCISTNSFNTCFCANHIKNCERTNLCNCSLHSNNQGYHDCHISRPYCCNYRPESACTVNKPCIVIPLHHFNTDILSQILSHANQNNESLSAKSQFSLDCTN